MTESEFISAFREQFGVPEFGWDGNEIPERPMHASNHNLTIHGNNSFSTENETTTRNPKFAPDSFLRGFDNSYDVPIVGVVAGGDWECPVQYFLFKFPDSTVPGESEGNIEGYAPTAGNLFNPYNGNKPFGNWADNDPDELHPDTKWALEKGPMSDEKEEKMETWEEFPDLKPTFDPVGTNLDPYVDTEAMIEEFLNWYGSRVR